MQTTLLLIASLALAAPSPSTADGGGSCGAPEPKDDKAALWAVLGNFDEYPGAVPYEVADEMTIGEASLHMAGFATGDPPQKIIDFYRAEFKREKLFIPQGPPPGPYQGITAFNPKGDMEKTVMVQPGAGGPTRVFLSISPGKGLTEKSIQSGSEPPAGLPVYAGAEGMYRTDARDRGRFSSTASYFVKTDPGRVLDFIRQDLSSKGWSQSREQGEPGGGLRYQRSDETVEITLLPMGAEGTEVTYVYVH